MLLLLQCTSWQSYRLLLRWSRQWLNESKIHVSERLRLLLWSLAMAALKPLMMRRLRRLELWCLAVHLNQKLIFEQRVGPRLGLVILRFC